ncbi:DUF3857 and transglutaminase domain-containing protein [candidate division KSB1 bacterium]|nr:DUF3857 and transglutaminase domain-containing protein [candidate division KSB1 bacterium]
MAPEFSENTASSQSGSHRRIFYALILLISIYFSCAGPGRWARLIEWEDYEFSKLPTSTEYSEAEAIMLLDDGRMTVHATKNISFSHFSQHRIIKILARAGLRWADITIPYSSQSKVKNIIARTISPDGKITMLSEKNIFDVNLYPDWIFYSDIRAKRFTLPAVETGCIVEYSYEKELQNVSYWNNWNFQHSIPTLLSRYSMRIPADWDYYVQTYPASIEPGKSGNKVTSTKSEYVWEQRNVPPLRYEVAMPAVSDVVNRVAFSPAFVSNWSDISTWFLHLAEERMKPDEAIKSFTGELIRGSNSQRQSLERIFRFVRDNVRYVAIEIGIGGYQPHFAHETFLNRYGDCKDMAALLIAMMDVAGLKAYPALVSTRQNGKVDTTLASHNQFNHVIVCAVLPDSATLWLDPTDKDCAFGELPYYDQGTCAFIVEPEGKYEFRFTPSNPAAKNLHQMTWDVKLDSSGRLAGSCEMHLHGVPAQRTRRLLAEMNSFQQTQWAASNAVDYCAGASLEQLSIENLFSPAHPLVIKFQVDVPHFAVVDSNYLILEGNIFRQSQFEDMFNTSERIHPVHFNYLPKSKDFIKLNLPETYVLHYVPDDFDDSTKLADYEIKYRSNKNELEVFRYLQFKQQEIPKAGYSEMRSFFQKIGRAERRKLILRCKNSND